MEHLNRSMELSLPAEKKFFSKIGFAYFWLVLITVALQMAAATAVFAFFPEWTKSPWYIWCISTLPMYLVAVPICLLLLRRIPAESWEASTISFGKWLCYFIISISVMYVGNLVGNLLSGLIGLLFGKSMLNPLAKLLFGANPYLVVLFVVIIIPPIEEYIFRKVLIDRLHRYGDKVAILLSALIFGLAHGNLYQFFYAFGLGALFAYIYCKTRRIRYSTYLHMIINAIGGIIGPLLTQGINANDLAKAQAGDYQALMENLIEVLPTLLLLGLFGMAMMGLAIAGIVLMITWRKRVILTPGTSPLPNGQEKSIVFGNAGMICFFAACACMFVLALLK